VSVPAPSDPFDPYAFDQEAIDAVALEAVANVMKVNNKRVMAIVEQERTWDIAHIWHSIVDGQDTDAALAQIKADIEYRNNGPLMVNVQ